MKRQNNVLTILSSPKSDLSFCLTASPNIIDFHDDDMIFFQPIKSITCRVKFSDKTQLLTRIKIH